MTINLSDIRLTPILDSVFREKISDEVYFSKEYSDYISNSRLKLINPDCDGSPLKYQAGLSNEFSQGFMLGSCVHELLLQPEEFNLVEDLNKPGYKLGQVIDLIIKFRKEGNTIWDSIYQACTTIHYYENTIKSKVPFIIREGFEYYWKSKRYNSNDIILSLRDRNIVNSCLSNLKANRQVKNLINPTDIFGDPILSYNEDAFFITLNGTYQDKSCQLKLKMKADNWSIDLENKIITLNDLKTTSSLIPDFMEHSFEHFYYYQQFALYSWILRRYAEKEYGFNKEEWQFNCNVIVVSTKGDNNTGVFKISQDHLERGRKLFCRLLKMVAFCEMNGYSDEYTFI